MEIYDSLHGIVSRSIHRIESDSLVDAVDHLVEEAPLEIRLIYGPAGRRREQPIAVTMRTPGHEAELALGFLFTEAIIGDPTEVMDCQYYPDQSRISVHLDARRSIDLSRLDRHFYTSSSCGVCGKGSLEMVEAVSCYYPRPGYPRSARQVLSQLPQQLREAQSLFSLTGGIHAAGLFQATGELLAVREDVGRHNAVDKLIGWALRAGRVPLRDALLVLSGRIGFELVQKAAMAGIPLIAAVGAPSSLAVELAEASDMTLVGFLRDHRMNVYCGIERVVV